MSGRDVLVIGATGGCGQHAYRECVAQGLQVEAMVRNVEKARALLGAEAVLVQGDMTKPDTLDAAFHGVKRIVMAIGKSRGEPGSSSEAIDYEGVRNVAVAAAKHGVRKIIHVTSNGIDSPKRPFIAFLNYMTGYGLGWKLRGEQALRDSGVPYVVVRPVGLKNKDDEVPPVIKQCVPYEWGMCMISRKVVGQILVHALLEEGCKNCTVNCREDPALVKGGKGIKDYDWKGVLGGLEADTPIPATFEDHVAGVEKAKQQVKLWGVLAAAAIGAGLFLYSRLK